MSQIQFQSTRCKQVGILYLIYPYEYAVKNKPIYKLGVHQNLEPHNSYNRYNSYEKGSEIIYYFKINNLYENEQKCIKTLTNLELKYEKGNEYFTGSLQIIFNKIYNVIKNDIIAFCDLDFDIFFDYKYNTFRKINIYFDEHFNKKYFDFIKNKFNEKNAISNYNYRRNNLRYLLEDYKNEILCNNMYLFIDDNNDKIYDNEINNDNQELKYDNQEINNDSQEINNDNQEINNDNQEINNDNQEINNDNQEINNDNQEINNDNQEISNDNQEIDNVEKNTIILNKAIHTFCYNKDNSCFICNRCLHTFFYKSDLQRHLNKKTLCKTVCNSDLSKSEIIELSLNKRFYFINSIKIDDLEKKHLIFLVKNYKEKLNIIDNLNTVNKYVIQNNNILNNDTINIQNNKTNNETSNNIISNKPLNIDKITVFINGIKYYKCNKCYSLYKRKENYMEHLANPELCKKRKYQYDIINNNIN